MLKLGQLIASSVVTASILVTTAQAETLIRVSLVDKIGAVDLSKSTGLGMGMKGDMSMAGMAINVSPKVVPRGKVRFDVTNLASNYVHEVILAPVTDENQQLAFDATSNKVNQAAITTLGQLSEIEPYKSVSMTLELKPGKYALYCNLPGHFMAGMWTAIEVK